ERVGQLRDLTDDPLLSTVDHDPLAQLYRETVSMTDCVLRAVQAFPESPSIQIRLCEGLEAVLCVVAERLATITTALEQRRREATRRQALADLLGALAAGHTIASTALLPIAESVREDAAQGLPLQ